MNVNVNVKRLLGALGIAVALAGSAAAQSPTAELEGKLSVAARDTIDRLIDSARVAGLPTAPLVAKAAEGVLKRVDEPRIVRAVRSLTRQLSVARGILPRDAATGTLVAAANALQAGVSTRALSRLAAASPESDAALAVGFVTIADLVASSVPPDAAAASIEQLLQRQAPESEMAAFRSAVARDIQAGRSAEDALSTRTKAVVQSLSGPRARP
jgi:hypothetical protein